MKVPAAALALRIRNVLHHGTMGARVHSCRALSFPTVCTTKPFKTKPANSNKPAPPDLKSVPMCPGENVYLCIGTFIPSSRRASVIGHNPVGVVLFILRPVTRVALPRNPGLEAEPRWGLSLRMCELLLRLVSGRWDWRAKPYELPRATFLCPKGAMSKAQGCRDAATLGEDGNKPRQPQRGCGH